MIFANLACPLLFARMTSADIVSAVWACAAGLCVIVGIVCALLRKTDAEPSSPRAPRGKAKPKVVRDFVAIDFETANARLYSACSLGLVRFERGEPVERRYWLLNPQTGFAPENVEIHGITPDQVEGKPTFRDIWPELLCYLLRHCVVTYSDFDSKVIRSLIKHYNLTTDASPVKIDFIDVCDFARQSIRGLSNYKLPTVAEYLNIDGIKHHNALSDAETCGRIYWWLTQRNGKAPIQASYGESATYAQQDYIRVLGGRIPPVLSKQDASRMISALLEEKYRRDAEEAEWKALQREDAELAQVSASLATRPEYKPRKGTSQRTRDLRDLQYMIARIISDKTIDMSEVQELSTWLESHKVAPDDFADTLAILNQSAAAGSVADPDALYTSLLACVRLIRTRPTI